MNKIHVFFSSVRKKVGKIRWDYPDKNPSILNFMTHESYDIHLFCNIFYTYVVIFYLMDNYYLIGTLKLGNFGTVKYHESFHLALHSYRYLT